MDFEIVDMVSAGDVERIREGLLECNLARIEDKNPRDLGVYLRDEDGVMMAGLTGDTHGNWLHVKYLWVDGKLRGQGIGRRILSQAEEEARTRGCKYVFLDTFSFQAPGFYKKQGYEQAFELLEYPVTGKRHYFTKRLDVE